MKRRNFISTAIGGIASVNIIGNARSAEVSAEHKQFMQSMEEAERIRATKGVSAMEEFLANSPYDYVNKEFKSEVQLGDDASSMDTQTQIEPDKISSPKDSGIIFEVTGTADPYTQHHFFKLGVNYTFTKEWINDSTQCGFKYNGNEYSTGEKPKDGVAIDYKPTEDYWDLATGNINDDLFTSQYSEYYSDASDFSSGGIGYNYDDRKAWSDWVEEDSDGHNKDCNDPTQIVEDEVYAGLTGVYLKPNPGHLPENRKVYAKYVHSHNSFAYNPSLSIEYPGVVPSIEPKSQVGQVQINADKDGNPLMLSQGEFTGIAP